MGIAEICRYLDGLPLAIELAAAKKPPSSPAPALLERLRLRMPILVSHNPRLPARQRRLEDAIDWSYQQLDAKTQALFNRLSLFMGGWTIEAAEAIAPDPTFAIDGMEQLLDNSLIVQRSTTQIFLALVCWRRCVSLV